MSGTSHDIRKVSHANTKWKTKKKRIYNKFDLKMQKFFLTLSDKVQTKKDKNVKFCFTTENHVCNVFQLRAPDGLAKIELSGSENDTRQWIELFNHRLYSHRSSFPTVLFIHNQFSIYSSSCYFNTD